MMKKNLYWMYCNKSYQLLEIVLICDIHVYLDLLKFKEKNNKLINYFFIINFVVKFQTCRINWIINPHITFSKHPQSYNCTYT